jgi:hypothetical protein
VDNTITYEEMMKQRAAKLVTNERKARKVTVDESQWEAVEEVSKETEEESTTVNQSKKVKQKKTLHLDEFVRKQGGGRGNRGNRGRGRGGRPSRQERVQLDDPNAFPALGQR